MSVAHQGIAAGQVNIRGWRGTVSHSVSLQWHKFSEDILTVRHPTPQVSLARIRSHVHFWWSVSLRPSAYTPEQTIGLTIFYHITWKLDSWTNWEYFWQEKNTFELSGTNNDEATPHRVFGVVNETVCYVKSILMCTTQSTYWINKSYW